MVKFFVAALAAACAICGVNAQSASLTDCHKHGDVEYCYLPDGSETRISPTATSAPAAKTTFQTTAVTDCHVHDATPVCVNGAGDEVQLVLAATQTAASPLPTAYNNCHSHGDEMHCDGPDGSEVEFKSLGHGHDDHDEHEHDHDEDDHDHDHEEESNCHTHDGVEHCHEGEDAHTHSESEDVSSHSHDEEEGCHMHDGVEHCHDGEAGHTHSAAESANANAETTPRECHFHAGVEHCTGGTPEQQAATCERVDRDYNINLRIGLIFAMLAGSAFAVYLPLFLKSVLKMDTSGLIFTVIKQFGTGVIIATAFVHLLTHAHLMFANDCLPPLKYEATTTAISMAGAFIAFLVEYTGHRLATWRRGSIAASQARLDSEASDDNSAVMPSKEAHSHEPHSHVGVHHTHTHATDHATGLEGLSHHHNVVPDAETCSIAPQDKFSVFVLEAGIIFHSILLGITLVVAGDSVFITLFIVILFHQMFEGLALGARIAALASPSASHGLFSWDRVKNLIMPGLFAIITPVGMAIGIGVLQTFNGNDPNTVIALGTLDALSAGILLWVGLVGMWAHDWMFGELRDAGWRKTVPALIALVCGLILMGILGKWA